jgi:MerR family transcriptional regulator, mercuric resistance operon regulatory protein
MNTLLNSVTIGVLAERAGVNVETIRFYQRKRLMPEPKRAQGGIRRYGEAELARLRFIRAAQGLGFSLDEVAEVLKLEDGTRCGEARRLAERKLEDVREKLAVLRRMESALGDLVVRCSSARGSIKCPLIASLRQTRGEL